MDRIKISVCIPVYEMTYGVDFLRRSFEMLKKQTFKDFEVVISDDSLSDNVVILCEQYRKGLRIEDAGFNIRYVKGLKGMAANSNNAIKHASGELVKILYMDDYLTHENSLQEIVDNFKGNWLVSACTHDPGNRLHLPYFTSDIHVLNTIGSPSVLTMKNGLDIYFDETLGWMLDCDLYKRLYEKFGRPTILKDVNVTIGIHDGQATNLLTRSAKEQEYNFLKQKYDSLT